MSDSNSIINLGELAKPATVLVEKISDAVGGIARPWQIKRVAEAEAEADRIRAVAQIEVTELHQRAMRRMKSVAGFVEYLRNEWKQHGYKTKPEPEPNATTAGN